MSNKTSQAVSHVPKMIMMADTKDLHHDLVDRIVPGIEAYVRRLEKTLLLISKAPRGDVSGFYLDEVMGALAFDPLDQ